MKTKTIKESNEMKKSTQEPKPVRFYKKASFPWALIALAVAFVIGLYVGWTAFAAQTADIKAEVASQVASLKEVSK